MELISKEEVEKAKEYRSMEQPEFKRHDKKKEFKKGGNGKGFKPRPAPKSAVDSFVGRDVKLKMRDGTQEAGRLESIFQYEYVITGADGMPVIILKHAVDSIRLKVS